MRKLMVGMPFEIDVELPPKTAGSRARVNVRLEAPDGSSVCLPAFWVGGQKFKARLVSNQPGLHPWTFFIEGSEKPFQTGCVQIQPVPARDPRPTLYRNGRLHVAASRTTLEWSNGQPFLWLGDTWWFGLTLRLDYPKGFQTLMKDRIAKGFNVVQIVAGPLPDMDANDNPFDLQQANEGGLPWTPGWKQLNPAYYDAADRRIACLVENGIVPCIVGMWGYFLPFMGIERVQQHWRNLVARYAAYPVVWCLAGEGNMPTYSTRADRWKTVTQEQEEGWTQVARTVRQLDPFHNLITIHPSSPDSKAMVRDASLLDIDMLQTGHSGYDTLTPSIESLVKCRDSEPKMPTLNAEVNYEGIMGGSREEVQRFLVWSNLMEGACGFTYGAQGIWQMSTRKSPHRGWTGSWGDLYWPEAMHAPGSQQVGWARRLFERFEWNRFQPRIEPKALERKRASSLACGIPGKIALFYLPVNCMPEPLMGLNDNWFGGLIDITLEPGVKYRAWWFDPRTGAEVRSYPCRGNKTVRMGTITARADGFWTPPIKPSMEDWVLVLVS